MGVFDQALTSAALCWRIERADGAGIALTSHDQAIAQGGASFHPAPGIVPRSITRSLGLDPDSGEIEGALSSAALNETDLQLGRWDHAAVNLTAVDWSDGSAPAVTLLAGQLGEVSIERDGFSAALTGAAIKLERPVCPATSPECRAELGDRQCRVDLAGRSIRASVTDQVDGDLVLDRVIESRFLLGRLRYLRGANCGLQTKVIEVAGAQVRVRDVPRAAVEAGCIVELREGCDKRFATCVGRFANAANFRGEPHLPGNDLLTRYPGA